LHDFSLSQNNKLYHLLLFQGGSNTLIMVLNGEVLFVLYHLTIMKTNLS